MSFEGRRKSYLTAAMSFIFFLVKHAGLVLFYYWYDCCCIYCAVLQFMSEGIGMHSSDECKRLLGCYKGCPSIKICCT